MYVIGFRTPIRGSHPHGSIRVIQILFREPHPHKISESSCSLFIWMYLCQFILELNKINIILIVIHSIKILNGVRAFATVQILYQIRISKQYHVFLDFGSDFEFSTSYRYDKKKKIRSKLSIEFCVKNFTNYPGLFDISRFNLDALSINSFFFKSLVKSC